MRTWAIEMSEHRKIRKPKLRWSDVIQGDKSTEA